MGAEFGERLERGVDVEKVGAFAAVGDEYGPADGSGARRAPALAFFH